MTNEKFEALLVALKLGGYDLLEESDVDNMNSEQLCYIIINNNKLQFNVLERAISRYMDVLNKRKQLVKKEIDYLKGRVKDI